MQEIKSLTGLRFIGAFYILLFHFHIHGILPDLGWRLNNIINQGALGVNLFFVLSGLLLTYSHLRQVQVPLGKFMIKRLIRIGPVYWAGILASLVASVALSSYTDQFPAVLALDTFFLNGWVPNLAMKWFGGGGWSISCEFFFYLSFPFVLPYLKKATPAALSALLGVVFLAAAVPGLVHALRPDLLGFNWVYSFPLARIAEFFGGMLVGVLVYQHGWRVPAWTGVAAVAVLSVYLMYAGPRLEGYVSHNWLALPMLLVLVASVCTDQNPFFGWLNSRLFNYLGRVSYGFYIWQIVLFIILFGLREQGVLAERNNGWAATGIMLAASFVLADLSYRFLESPAHSWLAHRFIPRNKPAAAPAVSASSVHQLLFKD